MPFDIASLVDSCLALRRYSSLVFWILWCSLCPFKISNFQKILVEDAIDLSLHVYSLCYEPYTSSNPRENFFRPALLSNTVNYNAGLCYDCKHQMIHSTCDSTYFDHIFSACAKLIESKLPATCKNMTYSAHQKHFQTIWCADNISVMVSRTT